MKYNKILFGLGALAVTLASCSEDVEYTPAPAVNTPAVYFSLNDQSTIDLEESDTYFTVKVYRENTGATATYSVNATVATEDGTPIPAGLFRICEPKLDSDGKPETDADGNVIYQSYQEGTPFDGEATLKVEFPAGAGESDLRIDFGGKDNLTKMLSYMFDFKAAGESSPYYITDIKYDVSYTPWMDITEPNTIIDQTLWEPFGGEEITMENLSVQEHPIKTGLFRVLAPYKNSPYSAYYQYEGTTPDYLYINATVANEVYFSDSKGEPLTIYDTHLRFQEGQGFQEDYGWGWLGCMYSYYLLKEDFKNFGGEQVIEYTNFSGAAGQIKPVAGTGENPRQIRFANGKLYGIISHIADYNGMGGMAGKDWQLLVDGAQPTDWLDMGDTEYTDGFMGQYYKGAGYIIDTYDVPLQANGETPGLYRLLHPYLEGTWDYGTPESDFNVKFDISDPECVIIEPQDAYEDGDGVVQMCNAAGLYMSGMLSDQNGNRIQYTKQQIIEQGLNDKYENGVVTIMHPFLLTPSDREGYVNIRDIAEIAGSSFVPATINVPESNNTQSVRPRKLVNSPKSSKPAKIRYKKMRVEGTGDYIKL